MLKLRTAKDGLSSGILYDNASKSAQLLVVCEIVALQMQAVSLCREELKELFQLDTLTACSTAALLQGFCNEETSVLDTPLQRARETGVVSFVHKNLKAGQAVQTGHLGSDPSPFIES